MTITKRIDSITHMSAGAKSVTPPAPRSVKVELTAACDFKCWFCATGQGLRKKGHMDFALFQRITAEMREAGVEELGLFYLGESFLYPRLADAVRYAKQTLRFPYVFLTTNGYAATTEKVQAVMEAGLDSLKFSVNYADVAQAAAVTGRADAMVRVMAHMRSARALRDERGYPCRLYASSIRFDGEQQAKAEALAARLPVDEHYWLPLYNQAGYVTEEEAKRGLTPSAGNRGRLDALVPPLPCWALFTEGHVTWDGVLTGCCFSHTPAFDFGPLSSMSFMEAWHSPAAQALRSAHLREEIKGTPCEGCFKGVAA